MDKEDIIRLAIKIGTYDVSIRPFADCCALFSPEHPVLRAKLDEAEKLYTGAGLRELALASLEEAVIL
jgi:thiamine biosynthesis protein ThiI